MKRKCKTVWTVDYREFEKAVKETFGREYDFVAEESANNDSIYDFPDIDGDMDDAAERLIVKWQAGENVHMPAVTLLNALVSYGITDVGDYIIEVSW